LAALEKASEESRGLKFPSFLHPYMAKRKETFLELEFGGTGEIRFGPICEAVKKPST
jgi:hypothetical protein